MLLREYASRGLDNPAAIWQSAHVPFDPETAPSVTSDDLVPHIMSGAIAVRPEIERLEGVEAWCTFADPFGNQLGLYQDLTEGEVYPLLRQRWRDG